MPVSISTPAAPEPPSHHFVRDGEDEFAQDADGDVDMLANVRPTKRARLSNRGGALVTPGEIVTSDPQWMRYASTFLAPVSHPVHPRTAATGPTSPPPPRP